MILQNMNSSSRYLDVKRLAQITRQTGVKDYMVIGHSMSLKFVEIENNLNLSVREYLTQDLVRSRKIIDIQYNKLYDLLTIVVDKEE
jgi:hypothetical protein